MIFRFLYLLVAFCSCSSYKSYKDSLDQELDPPDHPETSTFFSNLSQAFATFNRGESAEQASLEGSPGDVTTIPFEFPLLPSYGINYFSKIARMVGSGSQRVQSVFVRIIYRLLQFHVEKLFGLRSYEYAVPRGNRYIGVEWDRNPDAWFSSLMAAFFPEATLSWIEFDMQARIKDVHLRRFDSIKEGDQVEFFPVLSDGSVQVDTNTLAHQDDPFKVVLYTIPKPLWNVTLRPGFTIMTGLRLQGDVFCMDQVVRSLVCGLEFAFDVSGEELDVLVTPTNGMPTLEASRLAFNFLSQAPIPTISLPIPHNIEAMLDNFQVPRLFCYHPTAFAAAPEHYERVLGQIVLGRIIDVWQQFGLTVTWQTIAAHLQRSLTSFLPDCSIELSEGITLPKQQIGEWDPDSGTYLIYKERVLKRQAYSLVLNIGKPLNLSLKQLSETMEKVYPHGLLVPSIVSKDILIARVFYALWTRLRGSHVPEKEANSKPTLPAQKPKKKKKRTRGKKGQAVISKVEAALQHAFDVTFNVFIEFMQDLESSHMDSLTEFAFIINSPANDYPDAASVVGKALELVKPISGVFRYTLLTLSTPYVPHIIAQQMIPLPIDTIFAFLSNGQILQDHSSHHLCELSIWGLFHLGGYPGCWNEYVE